MARLMSFFALALVALFGATFALDAHAAPVIVAVAASWAGGAVAAAIGLTGLGATVFGAAFSFIANSFASSLFGKESAPTADAGGSNFTSEVRGRSQIVRSSVEPFRLVIGQVKKSGPLVYAETTGSNNGIVWLVVPLAPHRCQGIPEVWLGDELAGDLDASGNVTTGRFAGKVRIIKRLGTPGQTAVADLIAESAGKWTAAHVGNGVTDLCVRFDMSDQSVFPNGVPNVSGVVKGALMLDPRDSATRYSNNWAIGVRHYLKLAATLGGLECEDDEVNDAYMIAAANISDERVRMAAHTNDFTADAATNLVNFAAEERLVADADGVRVASTGSLPAPLAAGTTYYYSRKTGTAGYLHSTAQNALEGISPIDLTTAGTGTHTLTHWDQARYTANGTIDISRKPKDILVDLMTAGAGTITYPVGEFRLFAGAYTAPVISINESDLRGPLKTRKGVARRELFNGMRGTISSPANFWQPADVPPITNATYVTEDDGEEIWRNVEMPFTTDSIRAQRILKIHLEESRQDIFTELPGKMKLFDLAVCESANVSIARYGWSPLVMRTTGWTLGANGIGVDIKLRKTSASCYDWNSGEASTLPAPPDTNLPSPFNVAAPGAPVVTESLYQTTGSAGVKTLAAMSWSPAADVLVADYEPQYKAHGDTIWTPLPTQIGTSRNIEDLAPGIYDFRVRGMSIAGVRSAYSPVTVKELYGLTATPADVTGFSVIKASGVGIAQFDLHPDLDVRIGGRIVVRWSPEYTGATWLGSVVFEEYNGDAVSGIIPLRAGTYLAKAVDSTNKYSTTEVAFVVSEGLITGFTTVGTLTEHATFTGAKTNVVLSGGSISLDASFTFDSAPGLFDATAGSFDAYGTAVPALGTYYFSTYLDLTTVKTRRFEAHIAALQFDTTLVFDARGGTVDDWADWDGGAINDCDATLYASLTDDDPAGSPTWGPWTPFFVSDFTGRAAQFKLALISGSTTHNISVSELSITAKEPI